jgi:hypothetical protein
LIPLSQPLKELLKQDFFRYLINLRLSTTISHQLVRLLGFEGKIGRPRSMNVRSEACRNERGHSNLLGQRLSLLEEAAE